MSPPIPMPSAGRLSALWMQEHSNRKLNAARECSALTDPGTLPAESHCEGDDLPKTFQSIGSLGLANMEGKFNASLFPPDFPFFDLDLAPESLYDPAIPDELKDKVRQRLFLLKLQIIATLESANVVNPNRYSGMGFRSHKRNVINSTLVTGEALEHIDDEYRFRMFRRDQYVTRRDQCGNVLYHTIREIKDPCTLKEGEFAKSGLNYTEIKAKPVNEREKELFTKVEWQHETKKWTITQELNGQTVNEFDEEYSPYFSTTFRLVSGEHYGRGYIEKLAPDLRTLNELEVRRLDMLAAASRVNPIIDYASQVRAEDLAKPNGRPIRCKVVGGVAQDIGFFGYPNVREFQMLTQGIQEKYTSLGRSFLLESQSVPQQDRVTRYQVFRIAQEIEGITGGFYVPVAEQQQVPLVRRVLWQMKRDKLVNINLPPRAVRIEAYTGAAALARANRAQDVLEYATVAAQLGDTALAKLNMGVVMDVLARYKNINEPGMVKSDEQIAKENQQAMEMAAKAQAMGKAIDVTGNIAEANATRN